MTHQRIGVRKDIAELVDSDEAEAVTSLMTSIYYRLLLAPSEWWESDEALRVRGGTREGVSTTAWAELVNWLRVPAEEAHKAHEWMKEKKIIDYRTAQSGREIEISFEGLYMPEG
jgi:hypothetical protein